MHILEVRNLHKYFGGLAAVAGVDFHIDEGEIVGLIGPNGAGKTTLFNLISGAITPTAGMITFKDVEITKMKPHQICRHGIGRTFQLVNLFAHMTALDNVRLAACFGGAARRRSLLYEDPLELLSFVGLEGQEGTIAGDLPLVNQKRLEVARALATGPELLLLDELMAGLNPTEVREATELVLRIREKGVTILMIEHVMKAIMGVSDRIIALHYGKKIAEGTPQEIAENQTIKEIYLGT